MKIKKSFIGYNCKEVEEYVAKLEEESTKNSESLAKFAEMLKAVNAKTAPLTEEIATLKEENTKLQGQTNKFKEDISDTLIAAQKTAKEVEDTAKYEASYILSKAHKEAEEIIYEAKKNAENIGKEATLEVARQQKTMTYMRTQLLESRKRIDVILENVKAEQVTVFSKKESKGIISE